MPAIHTASPDATLPARLLGGFAYPVHGNALPLCGVLALGFYLALLPGLAGSFALILLWIMIWGYAVDCMIQTAEGYADPPEVTLADRAGNRRAILSINVLALLVLVALRLAAPQALVPALAITVIVLPAIDMSLAFDGNFALALNPLTWIRVGARFGPAYCVPVIASVVLGLVLGVAAAGILRLPNAIASPVFGFLCCYVVVLQFHWMGVLIWHYRERLGATPEAPVLARQTSDGADAELLRECAGLARSDPEEAAIRLRDRIRARAAPIAVHTRFRGLLRQLHRDDLLLQHGQTWIAQLCASGEARRALGVAQECREIDPAFAPDAPDATAQLAELAARLGMQRLAAHLAQQFVQRWPQHVAAPGLRRLLAPRGEQS